MTCLSMSINNRLQVNLFIDLSNFKSCCFSCTAESGCCSVSAESDESTTMGLEMKTCSRPTLTSAAQASLCTHPLTIILLVDRQAANLLGHLAREWPKLHCRLAAWPLGGSCAPGLLQSSGSINLGPTSSGLKALSLHVSCVAACLKCCGTMCCISAAKAIVTHVSVHLLQVVVYLHTNTAS